MDQVRVAYGDRHAGLLCDMAPPARLDLLAEGFPILLASAREFRCAAARLPGKSREARLLSALAEEEAARILILMDLVRCPARQAQRRVGRIVRHFYDPLARLIYADAQRWKPVHLAQLRAFVDHAREAHYLDGYAGDDVAPNWHRYSYGSAVHADIALHADGVARWSRPGDAGPSGPALEPIALELAEAMSTAGMFDRRGLQAVSEIWDQVDFTGRQTPEDSRQLTRTLLQRLDEEGLVTHAVTGAHLHLHLHLLLHDWQMPMYDLAFNETVIAPDTLHEARDEFRIAPIARRG